MHKHTIQKAVLDAIRLTGSRRLLQGRSAGSGAILTFHRVRPFERKSFSPNAHLEVTPGFLAALIDWARSRRIEIVDLDEAKRRLANQASGRFLVLTFDDGFHDNLEYALPVLKAADAPFTIYIATGFTDRTANPWWMSLESIISRNETVEHPDGASGPLPTSDDSKKIIAFNKISDWLQAVPEVDQRQAMGRMATQYDLDVTAVIDEAFMDWGQLERLASEPIATIGAHTHNHFALGKLTLDAAREEIVVSSDLLASRLGRRPRHFAYPYGFPAAVGMRDYRLLTDLGFATAVLTSPGVLRPENLALSTAWPRISMNGHFQSIRHVETLVSGVPFWPGQVLRRFLGKSRVASATAMASASSG